MGTLMNTQTVTAYVSKWFDYVVPRVNVRAFTNQKPWVNGGVRAKLKARSSAYSSGDPEALRGPNMVFGGPSEIPKEPTGIS